MLTMLDKSVKSELDRDSNIKYDNLSRGTEAGKTCLTLQKLSNGLVRSVRLSYKVKFRSPTKEQCLSSKQKKQDTQTSWQTQLEFLLYSVRALSTGPSFSLKITPFGIFAKINAQSIFGHYRCLSKTKRAVKRNVSHRRYSWWWVPLSVED
eukprot:scaffold2767_cov177-Amphora_coffeaeformis.AAC.73